MEDPAPLFFTWPTRQLLTLTSTAASDFGGSLSLDLRTWLAWWGTHDDR
jgi:hypothetical protein